MPKRFVRLTRLIRKYHLLIAILVCVVFFVAYSTLSIVRHLHYESYGFDLGINDQTVWRYSRFESPVSTISPFPDKSKLSLHVELVYALISPFYWIWPTRKMLLLVSAFVISSGGFAAYLLALRKIRRKTIAYAIMFSFLAFYGVQNAVWFDVHSSTFAAAFLMWFIYFLDSRMNKMTILFFVLAITSKENIALYTLTISLIYLVRRKQLLIVILAVLSLIYLCFIYLVYFPHVADVTYLYQNKEGLLSNLNPVFLVNTNEKLITMLYSFFSFGFLPVLNPLTLPLIFAHFTTFFVIASDLPGAQGLFGHYRVTLDPMFTWATIVTIATFKFLNKKWIAVYLIICTFAVQYMLHLPLSYFTKLWFWTEPPAVANITQLIDYLPRDASVASQNNITPHISHRDKIYTLYPVVHLMTDTTICGKLKCEWVEWFGNPEYVIVDTSSNWDIRHLLANREDYIRSLNNIEKAGLITKYKQIGNAVLYKTVKPQ